MDEAEDHGYYHREVSTSTTKHEKQGNKYSSLTLPYLLNLVIKLMVSQGCGEEICSYLGNSTPYLYEIAPF